MHQVAIRVMQLPTDPGGRFDTELLDIVVIGSRLVPARRRIWTYIKTFFTAGPLYTWRLRAMQQDQIKLAFVKWHHDRDDETTWTYDEDADIISLRDRIRRRRGQLG